MRVLRSVAAAVVVTVLCAPSPSTAGTLLFTVGGPELLVEFGLEPFQLGDQASSDGFQVGDSLFVSFDFVDVTLISGPLLNLDVDTVNGLTTYDYGAGTLTLDIQASRNDGRTAAGQALLPTLPFSITVCEGCDTLFGGGLADDFAIELGQGLIDPQLAALLRIEPGIGGGEIDFGLEDIQGDPSSESRLAADHRGYAELAIDVAEVPEPSLPLLLLTGAAAIFWRRGTSRARSSEPRSGNP